MKITLEQIQRQTDLTATEALIKKRNKTKNPTSSPVFFHIIGYYCKSEKFKSFPVLLMLKKSADFFYLRILLHNCFPSTGNNC